MSAPNAPALVSPISAVSVDLAIIQRFSWIFSDPDVGDSQSKFDLQYRIVGAVSWIPVVGITPNNFYDLPAATLSAGSYEWQARNYDSGGLPGAYSASSFFTAAAAPASISITTPISGATVAPAPVFTWSTPSQTSYQFRRVEDVGGAPSALVYYDTGEVIDIPTRSIVLALETNNRYEWLQIRVKNAGLWSAYVSIRVLVSYTQPSPGNISITSDNATGAMIITASPAAVGVGEPTPIYIDIYVRNIAVESGYGAKILANQFPTGVYRWNVPISGVTYEVRSLTTADNGAQRFSLAIYYNTIDGGTPSTIFVDTLDGGIPSTTFVNTIDGGTP